MSARKWRAAEKTPVCKPGVFEFIGFGMEYQQVKWSVGTIPHSMRFEALGPSNHCLLPLLRKTCY